MYVSYNKSINNAMQSMFRKIVGLIVSSIQVVDGVGENLRGKVF